MFHIRSRNDSAPACGTIPQGKGREGIRKGSGAERFRYVPCGSSGLDQIQSDGHLGRPWIGFDSKADSETCEHDWMRRGFQDDQWRECFLCGRVEDVS